MNNRSITLRHFLTHLMQDADNESMLDRPMEGIQLTGIPETEESHRGLMFVNHGNVVDLAAMTLVGMVEAVLNKNNAQTKEEALQEIREMFEHMQHANFMMAQQFGDLCGHEIAEAIAQEYKNCAADHDDAHELSQPGAQTTEFVTALDTALHALAEPEAHARASAIKDQVYKNLGIFHTPSGKKQ